MYVLRLRWVSNTDIMRLAYTFRQSCLYRLCVRVQDSIPLKGELAEMELHECQ